MPNFDYVTSAPTMYQKDYSSMPWVGSASDGTSDAHEFKTGYTPTAGSTFGSHSSADFGSTLYVVGANSSDHSNDTIGDLVDVDGFTFNFVAVFNSPADAPDTYPYYSRKIFASSDNNLYVTFTTAGVCAGFYDGTDYRTTTAIPLATGVKACIQVVYDGNYLKCRVNGSSWSTVAAANLDSATLTAQPQLGSVDMDLALACAWDRVLTSTDLNDLYSDAQANYGFEVNPVDLAMTLLVEDYTGVSPWAGVASAGTSVDHDLVTGVGAEPGSGSSYNGQGSADLSAGNLVTETTADAFIDGTGFYLGVVFKGSSWPNSSTVSGAAGLIGNAINFGMVLSEAVLPGGLNSGVTAFISEAGEPTQAKSVSVQVGPGDLHFAQMWFDGTNIGLNVDGQDSPLSAAIDTTYFDTYVGAWDISVGKAYSGYLDGDVCAVYAAKTPFTAEIRAGLLARAQRVFGLTLNPWVTRAHGEFTGPSDISGWNPRDGAAFVRLASGRLLYIGGWSDYEHWDHVGAVAGDEQTTNEVWASDDDGVTWSLILAHDPSPPTTGAGARFKRAHTRAVMPWNGIAVVMGSDHYSHTGNDIARGEVWWSNSDGTEWTLKVTPDAGEASPPYSATHVPTYGRVLYMFGNLSDDLYIIGGQTDVYDGGSGLEDMWKSTDGGLTWTKIFDNAVGYTALPWTGYPRGMVNSLAVHNGSLVVIGGGTYGAGDADVDFFTYNGVFSFDGTDWTTVLPDGHNAAEQFPRCSYTSNASAGGRLWLINGYRYYSDGEGHHVYYSDDDGSTWSEYRSRAGGPATHADATIVIGNSILRVPGSESEHGYRRNVYAIEPR